MNSLVVVVAGANSLRERASSFDERAVADLERVALDARARVLRVVVTARREALAAEVAEADVDREDERRVEDRAEAPRREELGTRGRERESGGGGGGGGGGGDNVTEAPQ